MKSAPFEYARAATLEEACALLAEHGDDAKVIAGGQSLVPMLAMRLLAPAWLIDVARLGALQSIAVQPGELVVGATVRQSVAEASAALTGATPRYASGVRAAIRAASATVNRCACAKVSSAGYAGSG